MTAPSTAPSQTGEAAFDDAGKIAAAMHAVAATGYAFVTPTPATHARVLARPGQGWAHSLRDVFGWSLPFRAGLLPPDLQRAVVAAGMVMEQDGGWRSRVRLSSLDGLLFTHSAYPTTAADSVFFGPDTYRFAQAIAGVLARPIRRAVDIGTGAGPGAILVSRACPDAEVVGVDINPAALRLARANALHAGVGARMLESDLLDGVEGQFDLVIANPPYMADAGQRAYRDGGGPLGAGLSLQIVDAALRRTAPGGTLLLYTGAAIIDGQDPFRDAAEAMLAPSGWTWTYREMDPDVFGEELEGGAYATADRIAAVVLTATRPA